MTSKISLLSKVFAILCILFSVLLILNFETAHSWLVDYTASNIIEEEEIMNPRRIIILRMGMILLIILALALALTLFLNLPQKLYNNVKDLVDFDRIKGIFFIDDQMGSNKYAVQTFVFSTIVAIIILLRQLILGDDVKEDIFEHISEISLLLSAFLFFIIQFFLKYLKVTKKHRRHIRLLFYVFGIGLLFIFLEEISYGQHIFKWETPELFKPYNFQEETNVHNIFNPFYRFIYPLFGFGLFGICSALWFFNKIPAPLWLMFITPHKSLIILVLLMASSTYKGHSESFEHMFALFALLYILRLLVYLIGEKNAR